MSEPVRILIVEDLLTDLDLAQREIRKAVDNCLFHHVQTHQDFLKALDSFQPDMILSDYHLPTFDGMTALRLAQERVPLTPLIIWTGTLSEDTAADCMKAGADNYIIKENISRLGPAVVHALEEGRLRWERKQGEEALIESERKYRTLTENLKELVYRADPHTFMPTYVNKAVEGIYGYTAEAWQNDPGLWEKSMHPDDRERVLAHFEKAQGQFEDSSVEYRILRKDGTPRWVIDRFGWERSPDGTVVALSGVLSDITENKRAEQAQRDSAKRFRALVAQFPATRNFDLRWQ